MFAQGGRRSNLRATCEAEYFKMTANSRPKYPLLHYTKTTFHATGQLSEINSPSNKLNNLHSRRINLITYKMPHNEMFLHRFLLFPIGFIFSTPSAFIQYIPQNWIYNSEGVKHIKVISYINPFH